MPIPRSLCSSTFEDLDLELVSGAWPADLDGELVISAPEPSPDLPYCLFGFGALVRISLRPGSHGAPPNRFALRARVIDTPSKRLFDKAPEVFQAQSFGYTSPLGFPNQANTAPLPWGDRLFATWDVGRPVEVDPESLTFLGEVGHRDDWGDPTFPIGGLLPFYFSSAHPIVDPERNVMFTVKLVMTPRFELELRLICWDPSGTELRSWPIANSVVAGSSHTLSQTRDWLILADSGNFKSDPGEMAGGPRTVIIDESAPVYLIRKDHLLATPPGTTFTPRFSRIAPTTGHFYGVWDDRDGIRVIFEHMDVMDLGFRLQADDLDAYGNPIDPAKVGFYNTAMASNSLSEVHIDPQTGVATRTALFREDWTYNLQLTAMDWSTEGLTRPTMHHVAYQGWRPDAVSQRALRRYQEAGRVAEVPGDETPGVLATFERDGLRLHDSWTFHDTGDHITSPIFAPRGAGTDPRRSRYAGTDPGGHDGFVVLPILSDDGFRVEVFDAAHVGRGPLAVLRAPGRVTLPALLHSAWMPSAGPAPEAERLRFGDELDDAQVDALPEHLPDVVRLVSGELADALG